MSPTMSNTCHLKTPSTVTSPDFGSCPRPEKDWNPDTPMIEIRTVPKKHQYQTLLNYGFIYNPTTIDENDFTRKSEAAFTLSRQFDNEDDNTNSNEEEIQSVSENDHSNNEKMVILVIVIIVTKVKKNMTVNRNKQICSYKVIFR